MFNESVNFGKMETENSFARIITYEIASRPKKTKCEGRKK